MLCFAAFVIGIAYSLHDIDDELLKKIVPFNIKSLELFYSKRNGDVFKIFETYTNIEKLFIGYKINKEIDYSFLKYLPKLKELIINGITI
jgi:hypothetical protein